MSGYRKVGIDRIGDTISRELSTWTADIQMGVAQLVDQKADKLKNEIKKRAPEHSYKIKNRKKGKYKKSFRVKVTNEKFTYYEKTVFASGNEYRLTHLLEKPHLKKNRRGMVNPKVHIAPATKKIRKEFEAGVEEIIKSSVRNGGGEKK